MPSSEGPKCVFLWAAPRSLSTTMSKCMSFVDGAQVWHEPYEYAYHKEKFAALVTSTDVTDQAVVKSMKQMAGKLADQVEEKPKGKLIDNKLLEYSWIKKQLETEDSDKKLIFVEDVACLVRKKLDFLPTERKYRHTFMISDPHQMYKAMQQMLQDMTPEAYRAAFDLRKFPMYDALRIYEYTCDLWKYVKDNLDSEPVIIDETELAANPEKLLPKYFECIGVPWKEEYLKWDSSPDVMTGWKTSYHAFVSATLMGTHKEALDSTCFTPQAKELPSRDGMSDDVIECINAAMPFYTEMYEQRLKL